MRLLPTSEFSARQASPYTDVELASSELLLDGKPTGLTVTGAVLEAAVEWQDYRIAFFTDDIPFEDMLRIYMFDDSMTLVDAAVLGAMYSTGRFDELKLQPPNALTFHFFGGTVWRVVPLPEKEFALPLLSDPAGVKRKLKFFRRFRIEGKPKPEEFIQSDIPRYPGPAALPSFESDAKMENTTVTLGGHYGFGTCETR